MEKKKALKPALKTKSEAVIKPEKTVRIVEEKKKSNKKLKANEPKVSQPIVLI